MGYFYTLLARLGGGIPSVVGLHLTISLGGIVFLGYPTALLVGAYSIAILTAQGIGIGFAVGATLIFSALTGSLFAWLFTRFSRESFAVISLASILAMDALVRSWDSVTGGTLGIAGIPRPSFAPTLAALAALATVVGLVVLVAEHVFLKTPAGRALRGMNENENVLRSMGISPARIGSAMLITASVGAGIEGAFGAWRIQFMDPSYLGIAALVWGLTIVILALKPSAWRLAGALLFVTLFPEALRFFALPSTIVGHMRLLLYAGILIIVVRQLALKNKLKRIV